MIRSLLDLWHIHKGRNHANKTKRNGIVARRLLEKNLGNLTNIFVNDSFGIVTRTIWFCFPNSLVRISPGKMGQGNPTNEFGKTKPKSSGNDPEEIVNKDLSKVSQIFLAKMTGNDPCLAVSFTWFRPRTWENFAGSLKISCCRKKTWKW